MKILVTGGAGFIGGHIVDHLLKEGADVVVLDNLDKNVHGKLVKKVFPPKVRFIRGSVLREADIRRAVSDVEVIFHEAAVGSVNPFANPYMSNNTVGTARLLDVLRRERHRLRKLVLASSMAVYGEGLYHCPVHGDRRPPRRSISQLQNQEWEVKCPDCGGYLEPKGITEETPPNPSTPYALSKYDQERLLLFFGMEMDVPVTVLRYFLTFGPRQSLLNPYSGVCSIFSLRLLNGYPPRLFEDGLQTRDMVYVDDVVRANIFFSRAGVGDFEILNVGTGEGKTLKELVEALNRIYGTNVPPLVESEFRLGDVRHIRASTERAAKFGFRATVAWREGLERFADWIRGEGMQQDRFERAYKQMRRTGLVVGGEKGRR